MKRLTLIFAATFLVAIDLSAQSNQTLPRGWEAVNADFLLHEVVNDSNNDRWQWHYDASEFDATGPILITEIYVRASSDLFLLNAFNFPLFTVTCHEAATDYLSHVANFAQNSMRSKVVKSGAWTGGPTLGTVGPTPVWVPFQLDTAFLYDPTTGNDFIIEVQKCGTGATWGVPMDAEIRNSGEGPIGGARYGLNNLCTPTSANIFDVDIAPVVRIDYRSASQTLPAGFDDVEGGSSTSFPFNTTNDHTWQWHYDAAEFEYQAPQSIRRLYFRPDGGGAYNAATVGSLEITLIEASTDYLAHDPTFANNVLRSSVVRTGSIDLPGAASAGGVAPWIDLGIVGGFEYDPSTGNDLIVQVRSCSTTPIGAQIDGHLLSGGGAARYGHTSSCTATAQNFSNTNFAPIVRVEFGPPLTCDTVITQYPHFQDFDAFPLGTAGAEGWRNVSGENDGGTGADWIIQFGPTSSANTGPLTDHTYQGRYAYVEDSGGEHASVEFISPCFDTVGITHPALRFRYHSLNANGVGTTTDNELYVDLLFDDGTVAIDVAGPLAVGSPEWEIAQVDLAPWAGTTFQVRFRATSNNNSFVHDMAIDDVYVGVGGSRDDLSLETQFDFAGRQDDSENDGAPGAFFHWRLTSPNNTFNGALTYLFGHVYADGPKPVADLAPLFYWPINQTLTLYNGAASPLGFLGVMNPYGVQDVWSVPQGLGAWTLVIQGVVVSGSAHNNAYATTVPHYIDIL